MVLIQLLLPTSAAGADGLAPLAETRRERAERFKGLTTGAFSGSSWPGGIRRTTISSR
jgi:hypothetical protein